MHDLLGQDLPGDHRAMFLECFDDPVVVRLPQQHDPIGHLEAGILARLLQSANHVARHSQHQQFIGQVREGSKATNDQLMEIMMAQDFQDLTGQVIKKVVEMAQTLEQQMLAVLIESMPAERKKERNEGLMNGPVIKSEGRDDVVTSQEQVDDLLESLGF